MVTTAKSSNHHSPPSAPSPAPLQPGDGNSPKFPRKNLPSPWAQVVRGAEAESMGGIHQSSPSSSSSSIAADQVPSSEVIRSPSPPDDNSNTVGVVVSVVDSSDGIDGNVDRSKKPVWNKPSNGVVETGPVMGAETWPALSASSKGFAKLPPELSSDTVPDGSLPTSQGSMNSQSPQKQATTNAKNNFASNYNVPSRQRSMKRGSGSNIGSGSSQSHFSNPPQPPPPPPFPVYQLPPVSYGSMVPGVPDPAPRDYYRNNNWDARPIVGGFVPAVNEYRSNSRRGYFGPHPRGDGSYHNRRDVDRGNYVNHRDGFASQPRMPPRGLLRHPPPPSATPFVAPQPIGPFANPMGFSEFYYYQPVPMEQFMGMPFFTHSPPPTPFFSVENPLSNGIVNQIEYYFSDANLVRDSYLRSKMDEQGWVSVNVIADFPRVKKLTTNIQLILDSLRLSSVVEVQGDKLRRHNEWMRWLPLVQQLPDSGSASPSGPRYAGLAANFETITLDQKIKNQGSPTSSSQSQLLDGRDARESSS